MVLQTKLIFKTFVGKEFPSNALKIIQLNNFLFQDEFDPSVIELNTSTSTDEAPGKIVIALHEDQKQPVLLKDSRNPGSTN